MDALELLTSDHDTVRGLFDRFRTAKENGDDEEMKSLQEQIFSELETHTRIEEEIFYPELRALDADELDDEVAESVQEHHVVKVLMREISDLSSDEVFEAKMTVLIENVEHHAEEEEEDMFPDVRERMSSEQLEDLGRRLEAAKG